MPQLPHPKRRAQDTGPLSNSLVCYNTHLVTSNFSVFHSALHFVSLRATIYQINSPPNLHNVHNFLHLPFQAAQTVKPASCHHRSRLPLPKAQRNCPVIVHSSTAHKGGGHRGKGGELAAVGVHCMKFEAPRFDSELCIKGNWLQICVQLKLCNKIILTRIIFELTRIPVDYHRYSYFLHTLPLPALTNILFCFWF